MSLIKLDRIVSCRGKYCEIFEENLRFATSSSEIRFFETHTWFDQRKEVTPKLLLLLLMLLLLLPTLFSIPIVDSGSDSSTCSLFDLVTHRRQQQQLLLQKLRLQLHTPLRQQLPFKSAAFNVRGGGGSGGRENPRRE